MALAGNRRLEVSKWKGQADELNSDWLSVVTSLAFTRCSKKLTQRLPKNTTELQLNPLQINRLDIKI